MFKVPLPSTTLSREVVDAPRESRLTVRDLWRNDVDSHTKQELQEKARFVPRVGNPRSRKRNMVGEVLAALIPTRSLDAVAAETKGRDKTQFFNLYSLLIKQSRTEIQKMAESAEKIEHLQVAAILQEHSLLDTVLRSKEQDAEKSEKSDTDTENSGGTKKTPMKRKLLPTLRKGLAKQKLRNRHWWENPSQKLPFQSRPPSPEY